VFDVHIIQAALLHDTVEDTDTTFEEIEREFGKAVRDLVAEVTDNKSLPKGFCALVFVSFPLFFFLLLSSHFLCFSILFFFFFLCHILCL
jgi:hypothetical protein